MRHGKAGALALGTVLWLAGSASEIGAQAIQGQLLDLRAGTPIGLATMTLLDGEAKPIVFTITNTEGRFILLAPKPGQYWLRAESEFHEDFSDGPMSLIGTDTLSLTFGLKPDPVTLDELVVEAESLSPRLEMEGFYDRMETGNGAYFDPDRLRARPGGMVSDIVALLPMVELWPDTLYGGVRVIFSQRQFERLHPTAPKRPVNCYPQVYLNGSLIAPGGDVPARLDEIPLNSLEGVEVYESPVGLPGRFTGFYEKCGTIVLWTG